MMNGDFILLSNSFESNRAGTWTWPLVELKVKLSLEALVETKILASPPPPPLSTGYLNGPVQDQEKALACIEGTAATKKKQVGSLQVRNPVPAKFFTLKSTLNSSPPLSIAVFTVVMNVRDALYDYTHSYVRDVTW